MCQDRIDSIVQQAEGFVSENHFDSEAIISKQQALVTRYENVQVRQTAKMEVFVTAFASF